MSQDLNEEKLKAEIAKLNAEKEKVLAETNDVKKAWYLRIQWWGAATPGILAIAALIYALSNNYFEGNLHELNSTRKEIQFSIDSLNQRKGNLSVANGRLSKLNDSLEEKTAGYRDSLNDEKAALKGYQGKLALNDVKLDKLLKEHGDVNEIKNLMNLHIRHWQALVEFKQKESDSLQSVTITLLKKIVDTVYDYKKQLYKASTLRDVQLTNMDRERSDAMLKYSVLKGKYDRQEKLFDAYKKDHQ